MTKLTTQYENLLLMCKYTLSDFIRTNGVYREGYTDKKVIILSLPSIENNFNYDPIGEYKFMDSSLNLIDSNGYSYDLNTIDDITSLFLFADDLPTTHVTDELVRIYACSEMDWDNQYTQERFYGSLNDAFEDIKDNIFKENHELRVQKWCRNENDWVDFTPKKIEIYNELESKSLGIYDCVEYGKNDAVERMKLIIREDLDGEDDDILEHDDITILMHYIHRNNENIKITYLY